MKSFDVAQTSLDSCVTAAQSEPIMLTQHGEPIALIVGVDGLDEEQIELGASSDFWTLIKARRTQPTISRQELERRLGAG
jgi:antitoxin (DNA-binding transcriptional repressor) of toxin-antitoxin stability system